MQNMKLLCKLAQEVEDRKPDLSNKLFEKGVSSLSDKELISILLRKGTKTLTLSQIAQKVLCCIDKNKPLDMENNLRKLKDLGDSKISIILAAFELGRRYHSPMYGKITDPIEVLPYLKHYAIRKKEHFICISLSGANEIISIRVVSVGTLTSTLVHPREVFADVITDRAAYVIFAHNHPSGNVEPSTVDIDITYRLVEAADLLGIEVLDHIIFSYRNNYVSLAERRIVESNIKSTEIL